MSVSPSDPRQRRLNAIAISHRRWLEGLGLLDRPWLILGSAPDPTLTPEILKTHARIDINNVGRTAQAMGLGRADLTFRAKHKSWDEHPHLDTRGLIWIHTLPRPLLSLVLARKPHEHVGTLTTMRREDREALVTHVSGASVAEIGELGKVTNGVAAICYGLFLGVPRIVVAGISLSKIGHSFDELGRHRKQIAEDAFVLERLKTEPRLSTTEADLAETAGIRMWEKIPG